MVASWTVRTLAMQGLRRLFGPHAKPGDHPEIWRNICLDIRAELENPGDPYDD